MDLTAYRTVRSTVLIAVFALLLATPAGADSVKLIGDEISPELRAALMAPVREKLAEFGKSENAEGTKNKRTSYSKRIRKIDDETYGVSIHVDTAEEDTLVTERMLLTLKKDGKGFKIADTEVKDTVSLLRRTEGLNCYPFDSFKFDREGMRMTASRGSVCETYYDGAVNSFSVGADDLAYDFTPPPYVDENYTVLNKFLKQDRARELIFEPSLFTFTCDAVTCDEIMQSSFAGLELKPIAERVTREINVPDGLPSGLSGHVKRWLKRQQEDRRESAFSGFFSPTTPDHRYYNAWAVKNDDHRIGIAYDPFDGYEVQFTVRQDTTDVEAMNGLIFGYFAEETYKNSTPYELEQRDDFTDRWYEVESLKGDVEMALEDPEMINADLTFGINLKQDMQILPFFIAAVPNLATGEAKPRSMFVNSVQLDGEELTWVRTSRISGIVVLPRTAKAGERIDLSMSFGTKAIIKINHAFSGMNRFGWMPFVSFGDFIDEFDMTIKAPAQYKILGVGHQVDHKKEGRIQVTHWRADNPVVFPTIIFGKYISDGTGEDYHAKKMDGTEIPVEVHVDEVSMNQLDIDVQTGQQAAEFTTAVNSGARGIRGKQLRPIASQAAVSINLYTEISGVDYPYGELNLVNDPSFTLYGQAPSSLIYLGSRVFRGEGTMAGDTLIGGGGANISKFLKSVVAHEVGHQWWGSRVSNANGRNYWFVESLAEYFSALYLEAAFGKKEYQEQVDEWRRRVLDVDQKTSVQTASTHWGGNFPGSAYQAAVYNKGPYMFHTLREMFGDEKFFAYLKKFSMELAGKREIVSRDIQLASVKYLGGVGPDGKEYNVDLEWFFDQWLRGVGLPQYRLEHSPPRRAENGDWIVEGVIHQRVVIGNSHEYEVMEGKQYRGVVAVTAVAKNGEFQQKVIVEGAETPFRIALKEKPLEIALNKYGGILSHDVKVNQGW